MDKTSYALWRWIIPGIIYATFVTVFVNLYEGYWIRFGLIFIARYLLFFNELIVNSQAKKQTFPVQGKARGFTKKTINVVLKSLILAFMVVSIVTYAMFGEDWSIRFDGMSIQINLAYYLIYFVLYLIVEVIVDAITAIKA